MTDLPIPSPRLQAYEQLGYGLFLHWGLYSLVASGEWVMNYRSIPREEYARLAATFSAEAFDATKLVRFAREAGFRYICLTTRHHDGFSLYDTRGLNDFDAPHSAAGRDLVAEFSEACHAAGMGMFFYHTTLDWREESFQSDWNAYQQYLRDSVEILCTHYGRVDGFWFDGNWACPERDWQEDALYGLIRSKQPDCIIVNNSSTKALGKIGHPEVDVVTFEQGRPGRIDRAGHSKYLASEMCETINSHWGCAADDASAKSPAQLIRTLAACRRFGANLLLNIGPNADGSLPDYERSALGIGGRWISRCAESIYKGRPTDFSAGGEDFVLFDGSDYFYYAHEVPIHGNLHLGGTSPALRTIDGDLPEIQSIHWVDNNEELSFQQNPGMLTFRATNHPYGSQFIVRVARLTRK